MIRLDSDTYAGTEAVRIWLIPNRALDWAQNRRLLLTYLFMALTVGAHFVRMDLWPVAVFILLTTALLIVATIAALQRLSWCECISMTPGRIQIQRGRKAAELECSCARSEARMRLLTCDSPWQSPRLLMTCGGTDWELGRDLNASDRRYLARLLQNTGIASMDASTARSAA